MHYIQHNRPKSRLVVDSPDASGGCLSRLLGVCPRLSASRAASGESSGGSGPRWGGAETKHGVQVEESFGKSFRGDALAPCLALEGCWKAQTRVFGRHRGVSRNRSRPHWTKTLNRDCHEQSPASLHHLRGQRPVGLVVNRKQVVGISTAFTRKTSFRHSRVRL